MKLSLTFSFFSAFFSSVLRTMESGLPMLNCLLQHTLRSLCTSSDSSFHSKWAYAVFWKILPRNYPPPKWDDRTGLFDRAKGNIRNWILVWEDGFCDFCECERAGSGYVKGRFGADIFFKMSHEVYNFGEGLIGKVASDNNHKWIFRDSPTEDDPTFISSWNVSIDPPRAWEAQFNSGIETIAIISVREGAIQLGSFNKVVEDLNLVISIQRKFSYLNSLPGTYAIQRPFLQFQNSNNFFHSNNSRLLTENNEIGTKRQNYQQLDILPTKSIYLGHNSPQNGISTGALSLCPIPPLLSKIPQSYYASEAFDHENTLLNNHGSNSKSVVFQEFPLADYSKVEATYARDEAARLEDREHCSNLR